MCITNSICGTWEGIIIFYFSCSPKGGKISPSSHTLGGLCAANILMIFILGAWELHMYIAVSACAPKFLLYLYCLEYSSLIHQNVRLCSSLAED